MGYPIFCSKQFASCFIEEAAPLPPFAIQEKKIFDAYFNDEIQPFKPEYCFCGTLSPDWLWAVQIAKERYPYTIDEYASMEKAFLGCFPGVEWLKPGHVRFTEELHYGIDYENYIFDGMCAGLRALRKIHTDRGEVIDDSKVLTQRQNPGKYGNVIKEHEISEIIRNSLGRAFGQTSCRMAIAIQSMCDNYIHRREYGNQSHERKRTAKPSGARHLNA